MCVLYKMNLKHMLIHPVKSSQAVKFHHIRGKRSSGGGLKPQHLACVNWLAHACQARVDGAYKGSSTLLFEPGQDPNASDSSLSPAFKKLTANGETVYECRLDIGTAGATGLALQAILPFILFSNFPSALPVRLTLTGGTNVSGSPSYEYIVQVLLPMLQLIGLPPIRPDLDRRGWSQGGSSIGRISFEIPCRASRALPAFSLRPKAFDDQPNKPITLSATFIAPASCHEHFRKVFVPAVQHHFGTEFALDAANLVCTCENSGHDKRMYLLLVASMPLPKVQEASPQKFYQLARDWLYLRKISSLERAATEMAEAVTNSLAEEVRSGAYVDEHMRDQLVIFEALADGRSEVYPGVDDESEPREPSLHTRTAEWVAKQLLGVKFDVASSCDGVAFGAEAEESVGSAMSQERSGMDNESIEEDLQRLEIRE
jgi:RNA 3'-terminal phosphate cyclase (ATP)